MIASHLVFGAYGFWLPNDPRGSWSTYLRNRKLLDYGDIVPVQTTRSVAANPHDVTRRLAAKESLQYPPVELTGIQALAAIKGFARAAEENEYCIFACAIMPNHVHLVVAEHRIEPKMIIKHLKARATTQMNKENLHPFREVKDRPSPWARGGWAVYLDTENDVWRAVKYVKQNPIKDGLKPQNWSFVTPFVSNKFDR